MKRLKELIEVFANTDNPADMKKLFQELFTPAEIKDITLRWQLMKDLDSGLTQREIAARYRMSLCKVTRGSRVLKQKDSICRNIFARKNRGKKPVPAAGGKE